MENMLVHNAESGDMDAQVALAAELGLGDEFVQDYAGSFYWYCRAATQGSTDALWNVGLVLLEEMYGIAGNQEVGATCVCLAAESFHPSAMQYVVRNFDRSTKLRNELSESSLSEIKTVLECADPTTFYQDPTTPYDVAANLSITLKKPITIRR